MPRQIEGVIYTYPDHAPNVKTRQGDAFVDSGVDGGLIADTRPERQAASLQNKSQTETIYIDFDREAEVGKSFAIGPLSTWEPFRPPSSRIFIKAAASALYYFYEG